MRGCEASGCDCRCARTVMCSTTALSAVEKSTETSTAFRLEKSRRGRQSSINKLCAAPSSFLASSSASSASAVVASAFVVVLLADTTKLSRFWSRGHPRAAMSRSRIGPGGILALAQNSVYLIRWRGRGEKVLARLGVWACVCGGGGGSLRVLMGWNCEWQAQR
jgi:hypothetical protein